MSSAPRPDGLSRQLGTGLLVALVVGDILGAGIYVLVGEVAREVGGLVWLPFSLALVIAACTAGSYAALAARFPHAAGSAHYVDLAFGIPLATFLTGFAVVASAISTSAAVSRAVGSQYLDAFVDAPAAPVALCVVAGLTVVAWLGIGTSARLVAVMTVIEVAGLLLVVAAGVTGWLDGSAQPGRLVDSGSTDVDTWGVLGAAALAFFAYLGFEDAVHLSEEVDDPERSFPTAMLAGLVVVGVLYVGVTVSVGALLKPDVLAASSSPLLDAIDVSVLRLPERVFAAIAIVAVTNTALLALTTASRQLYGLAEKGSLPRLLARVGRRRTPVPAIVLAATVVAVLAATGGVRELADTAVTLLLAVFAGVNLAHLRLRRAGVSVDRRVHTSPLRAMVAWVGLIGGLGLLVHAVSIGGASLACRVMGLVGAGLVAWVLAAER